MKSSKVSPCCHLKITPRSTITSQWWRSRISAVVFTLYTFYCQLRSLGPKGHLLANLRRHFQWFFRNTINLNKLPWEDLVKNVRLTLFLLKIQCDWILIHFIKMGKEITSHHHTSNTGTWLISTTLNLAPTG